MELFEKSMSVLSELFGQDYQFSLATAKDNKPSVRVVDIYYEEGAFWVVTYANTDKVKEIEENPNVALCSEFHSFKGNAYNMGHPLKEENRKIRETLINVFQPWYFEHNDENDMNMCYVKIDLTEGFFHKAGKGYRVNFTHKTVKEFDFVRE